MAILILVAIVDLKQIQPVLLLIRQGGLPLDVAVCVVTIAAQWRMHWFITIDRSAAKENEDESYQPCRSCLQEAPP